MSSHTQNVRPCPFCRELVRVRAWALDGACSMLIEHTSPGCPAVEMVTSIIQQGHEPMALGVLPDERDSHRKN